MKEAQGEEKVDSEAMYRTAFDEHNIVVIMLEDQCLNYEQAKEIAEKKALRLPTREELEKSGIKESDGMNLWAFVQRPDGKPDVVQLGKGHETIKERYFSHLDKLGPAEWLNDNVPEKSRPMFYF